MQDCSSWCRSGVHAGSGAPMRGGEWALGAALVASYPLSFVLPGPWAREAGPLENAQVAVLFIGALLALRFFLGTRPARSAMLGLWAAPVWLILAGRELSWGRAWLQEPGIDAAGRLVAVTPHWLQALAWPCAAALLAWMLFCAWRYRIDRLVRSALARRTPWLCLAIAVGGALGSTCAEGHMSCSMDLSPARAQLFEELCELLAYSALCMVQHAVLLHQARPGMAAPLARSAKKTEEVG